MQRASIGADDELGFLKDPGKLAQVRWRSDARADRLGEVAFSRTPDRQRLGSDPLGKLAKTLDRPELVRFAGPGKENDRVLVARNRNGVVGPVMECCGRSHSFCMFARGGG